MHNRMLIIIAVSAAMGLFSERASAAFYQEDFNSGFNVGDVLIDVTDWGQMPGGGDSDAIVICGSCGIGGSPGLERRTLDQDYEHIRLSISPPSGSYYEVRALISLPPGNVSVGLYNNRVDGNTSTGAQIDFSGNADFGVRFVAGSPEYNSPVDLSRDGPFGDWFEGRVAFDPMRGGAGSVHAWYRDVDDTTGDCLGSCGWTDAGSLNTGAKTGDLDWDIVQLELVLVRSSTSGPFVDNIQVDFIPEPGTMVFLGLGVVPVFLRRKRRS